MKTIFLLVSLLLQVIFVPYSFAQTSPLPAFPGAEGYGAMAKGGRGGVVIAVTNLNDNGTGSLRACIEASGPRTCVFKTGGTIVLNSSLDIRNPYITIAGQTAPGGGITLTGGTVSIQSNNVIIRYIRTRGSIDGINMLTENAHDIILDHITSTWGGDENMSTYTGSSARVKNVTIQWSIIAEGLTPHSKGLLLGYATDISVHHNLFAHNDERNPRCQVGNIDVVNNVIYNYGASNGWCDTKHGPVQINYVGNFTKTGPNSANKKELQADSTGYPISVYVEKNIGPNRPNDTDDEWLVLGGSGYTRSSIRFPFPQVTTTSAAQAFEDVLSQAGASANLDSQGILMPNRDGNNNQGDIKIINNVRTSTGNLVASILEAGGLPSISPGTPYTDTDSDGMPDAYETKTTGLNINVADNNGDIDSDGYTNLEEYLNGAVQTGVTPSISPTGQAGCPLKPKGDADCKPNGAGKNIDIADFEIWRKEYFSGCSTANMTTTSCQTDDDGIGTLMDANFDSDTTVTVADFEIWRKGYFSLL